MKSAQHKNRYAAVAAGGSRDSRKQQYKQQSRTETRNSETGKENCSNNKLIEEKKSGLGQFKLGTCNVCHNEVDTEASILFTRYV